MNFNVFSIIKILFYRWDRNYVIKTIIRYILYGIYEIYGKLNSLSLFLTVISK